MATEQLHERWIIILPKGGRREFDERHVFVARDPAMAFYADMRAFANVEVVREVHHIVR